MIQNIIDMNMKLFLFILFSLLTIHQKSFSQIFYQGNGINFSNDSIHIGGTSISNIMFKGINNHYRYNFFLDSFNLVNNNAKRIDFEGTDSVRLISNKLIKIMSNGDINFGSANSTVFDGNLTFKRYKKTNLNSGILTVDSCGILSVANNINLKNYLKQGGNYFGSDINIGSRDSSRVNILVNDMITTTWGLDYRRTLSHYGDIILSGFENVYPTIFMRDNNGHANSKWDNSGLHIKELDYTSSGISNPSGFLNFQLTGTPELKGGTLNSFSFEGNLYGSGTVNNYTFMKLTPFHVFSSVDSGIHRGLFINPSLFGNNDNMKRNYRSLEVTTGNVLLNSFSGGTGIGVSDTVNKSALFEIRGTDRGFLPPRLTTNNRNDITNPAYGLIIYNTDSSWVEVFTPNGWYKLLSNSVTTDNNYQSRVISKNIDERINNSFVTRVGNGIDKVFFIQHNLNSEFIMVQFIDCGPEANCNLLLCTPNGARLEIKNINEVRLAFETPPAYNRYKIMFLKL